MYRALAGVLPAKRVVYLPMAARRMSDAFGVSGRVTEIGAALTTGLVVDDHDCVAAESRNQVVDPAAVGSVEFARSPCCARAAECVIRRIPVLYTRAPCTQSTCSFAHGSISANSSTLHDTVPPALSNSVGTPPIARVLSASEIEANTYLSRITSLFMQTPEDEKTTQTEVL